MNPNDPLGGFFVVLCDLRVSNSRADASTAPRNRSGDRFRLGEVLTGAPLSSQYALEGSRSCLGVWERLWIRSRSRIWIRVRPRSRIPLPRPSGPPSAPQRRPSSVVIRGGWKVRDHAARTPAASFRAGRAVPECASRGSQVRHCVESTRTGAVRRHNAGR